MTFCGISDGADAFIGNVKRVTGLWFSLETNRFENFKSHFHILSFNFAAFY